MKTCCPIVYCSMFIKPKLSDVKQIFCQHKLQNWRQIPILREFWDTLYDLLPYYWEVKTQFVFLYGLVFAVKNLCHNKVSSLINEHPNYDVRYLNDIVGVLLAAL